MRHPLQRLPEGRRLPVFLALTGVSQVVHWRMTVHNDNPAAPHGMLSFLFGGTVGRDREILSSWDAPTQARAIRNLRLDPVFSVSWTGATSIGCLWADGPLRAVRAPSAGLGAPLAWAQLLAAALSTGKDLALLTELHHRPRRPWPQLAGAAGLLEIGMKSAGVAYAAAGGVAWCVGRTRRARRGG